MNSAISDLPVRTAIDLVLTDVTYSNALPEWLMPKGVDYSARQKAIETKIDQYLSGGRPKAPFEVWIPRRMAGVTAKWLQPCVNDQMVLQACTSSLAPRIDGKFDRKRVFSYRYNNDPNSTQLIEDQCSAWQDFKKQTVGDATAAGHVLVLDLEQSFVSIDRSHFIDYLRQFSTSGIESRTIKVLLDGFCASGVPLINNSLFFLGNAYLSVVDEVIASHTKDYKRFGDDYCVFGGSPKELESLYTNIKKDLQSRLGFRINELKLSILASEDYCSRLSSAGTESDAWDETDRYTHVPQGVDPNVLVTTLRDTVKDPSKYLNDGIGRFQLASLRKMRDLYPDWAASEFAKDLTRSPEALRAATQLMKTYAQEPKEVWRSVWLVYLMRGIDPATIPDKELRGDVQQVMARIQHSGAVPEVVRLWARSHHAQSSDGMYEQLSDAQYEEAGRRCCGA